MEFEARQLEIVPVAAVNAAIVKPDGTILLTRRSAKIREPFSWCLPGGHIEIGETWIEALHREIIEEVGLVVKKAELCGIYSDPSLTTTKEKVSEGYRAQFVVALFLVKEFAGEIRPNEEVDLWKWCTPSDLPTPIIRSHPIRVEDAFRFSGEVFVR